MQEDMEKIEIDEFYAFTKNPIDPDIGAIKLTRGPFEGLIYVYDEYKFSKVDEDTGQPSVRFAFNVLYVPEEVSGVDYPDEMKHEFSQLLGDILLDIVTKDSSKGVRVDYDNTNREGDIDESFERRVFYENSTPVLEE